MASKGNANGKRTPQGSSSTPQQREVRRRNRGKQESADWGSANPALLARVIVAIAGIGGAAQFGYTKAGDQYVIRVVGDGEPYNEYLRPTENVDYWLEGFALDYELDGEHPDTSVK